MHCTYLVTSLTLPQTKEDIYVCFIQKEVNTFNFKTVAANRRHSADGVISSESGSALGRGPAESARFHPYRRQFSGDGVMAAGCLQQCSSSFSCLQEVCSPDTHSYSSSSEASPSWDQYNSSVQVCRLIILAVPVFSMKYLCNLKITC